MAELLDPSRLEAILDRWTEKCRVPGAQVGIYYAGGSVIAAVGRESADGVAVEHSSTFPFGSVTKTFTATLLWRLATCGDLELDGSVGTYVPELTGWHEDMTVRHLLNHSSGLPADFLFRESPRLSPAHYARLCRDVDLLYAPGTGFSYSNVGFALLGRVVEHVTGMPWSEAVDLLVLRPLGSAPTFCAGAGRRGDPEVRVFGHSTGAGRDRVTPVKPVCPAHMAAAGGLGGTVSDLLDYGRLHVGVVADGAPADFADIGCMHETGDEIPAFGLADGWRLGFASYASGSGTWIGHDGTIGGTTCYLRINRAHGTVVALTANAISGTHLWQGVLHELTACGLDVGSYPVPYPPARPVAARNDAEGERIDGEYANGDLTWIVSHDAAGRPWITGSHRNPERLALHDDTVFSVEPGDGLGQRVLGRIGWQADGSVGHLDLNGRRIPRVKTQSGVRSEAT